MVIKYDESSALSDQWMFHWCCPSVRLSHMNYVEYMSVKFIYTIKKCKKSIDNYRKNTKENMVRSKCMNHFWSQIILNLTGSGTFWRKKKVFFLLEICCLIRTIPTLKIHNCVNVRKQEHFQVKSKFNCVF